MVMRREGRAIEMGAFPQGDEELGTVRIWASVGHTEKAFRVERARKVLVCKVSAVD